MTVYDIPVEWTDDQILQALNSWGYTIKFSTKKQRKFQTVWVKIVLNDEVRAHFDQGLWMYTLNNTPIRWFPGDWSLKERKHRERFCLVWRNCPEAQHTQRLVNQNLQSEFLAKYSIKAYKAIHAPKGERQLIVFFERHTDALKTSFDIENVTHNWSRGEPFRNKIPHKTARNGMNEDSSSKSRTQNRSKDQNPTKSNFRNKPKGSADVFNTLVDVLKKLASN
ncbi:hypothetical protein RclHR1_03170013 [Rhizophagus clarus]|uniref:Uncharacterized protein n=1 Tax=Rhizophagus clarus TaxID=94130 RepID=A0A2Z6R748_9GLOM|nr:hypothetical protein RclHR1_03170013 [Rhizophagus clarus]GET00494.1 hypothetical protein GLOIN_2v1765605 [Rhizophagus clarus]